MKLIDGLKAVTIKAGEYVFKEGDTGEEFFIIETGEVECVKNEEDGQVKVVRVLKRGDYFGEIALIKDIQRTLGVRALSKCELLKLDRETFRRLLGSIQKHLKTYIHS